MSNASAITLTIPTNASVAFSTGTMIGVIAEGAGTVTIAGAAGVTLDSKDSNTDIDGQDGVVLLIKKGTDLWNLSGNLA